MAVIAGAALPSHSLSITKNTNIFNIIIFNNARLRELFKFLGIIYPKTRYTIQILGSPPGGGSDMTILL
jgi:hypothetical protein